MTWDGRTERRKMSDDHDLLVRIHENLKNHIEIMSKHILDDEHRFDTVRKDLATHNKIIYGCIGVALFVEFVSKFIK